MVSRTLLISWAELPSSSTLAEDSEFDAWLSYYEQAVMIFAENGIRMDPAIRNDLNISFRQARQTAFSEGVILEAKADPNCAGLEIVNMEVVEHVSDAAAYLAACNTLLKPGGLMICLLTLVM